MEKKTYAMVSGALAVVLLVSMLAQVLGLFLDVKIPYIFETTEFGIFTYVLGVPSIVLIFASFIAVIALNKMAEKEKWFAKLKKK